MQHMAFSNHIGGQMGSIVIFKEKHFHTFTSKVLELSSLHWEDVACLLCPTCDVHVAVLRGGGTTIRVINRSTGEETGVFETDPWLRRC